MVLWLRPRLDASKWASIFSDIVFAGGEAKDLLAHDSSSWL